MHAIITVANENLKNMNVKGVISRKPILLKTKLPPHRIVVIIIQKKARARTEGEYEVVVSMRY